MSVIELAEYPEHFFFGGSIVSDKLNELEATLEPDDVNGNEHGRYPSYLHGPYKQNHR